MDLDGEEEDHIDDFDDEEDIDMDMGVDEEDIDEDEASFEHSLLPRILEHDNGLVILNLSHRPCLVVALNNLDHPFFRYGLSRVKQADLLIQADMEEFQGRQDEFVVERWATLSQILSSSPEFRSLTIKAHDSAQDDDVTQEFLDYNVVSNLLRLAQQVEFLHLSGAGEAWQVDPQGVQLIANGLCGHSSLQEIHLNSFRPDPGSTEIFVTALGTIPNLAKLMFSLPPNTDLQMPMFSMQSMTELLQFSSLCELTFEQGIYLDREPCLALSRALRNDAASATLTMLSLKDCIFPDEEAAASIADGLKYNSTVKKLDISLGSLTQEFSNTLADALITNTTLESLKLIGGIQDPDASASLEPIFRAFRTNSGVKSLFVSSLEWSNTLLDALRSSLEQNETMESFAIYSSQLKQDGWLRMTSFLQTNKSIKHLKLSSGDTLTGSTCIEIASMLPQNDHLEHLEIFLETIDAADVVTIVSAFKKNVSCKHLTIKSGIPVEEEDGKQIVAAMKYNYAIEKLNVRGIWSDDENGERLGIYLRLNRAGRRYLIEEHPSKSKGVQLLIDVSDDLDCLLTHLIENPSLCERDTSVAMDIKQQGGGNA